MTLPNTMPDTAAIGPLRLTLDAGALFVAERIAGAQSAALTLLIPGGTAHDPEDRLGMSAMWSELLFRGAGSLNSRQHADALDRLGIQSDGGPETFFQRLSFTMLGTRVADALPLIIDMLRAPRCDADSIEPVRDLSIQAIQALEDDPQERVMRSLKRFHAPPPINRSNLGTTEGLTAITRDDLVRHWGRTALPTGAIFAAAGAIDPDAIAAQLNTLLRGWSGEPDAIAWPEPTTRGLHHETDDTNQAQIAIAHDGPRAGDRTFPLERVVIAVLSGGMSGRLFTEVREKRSLCYSVFASYAAERDYGRTVAYVGTTPDKADEAASVLLEQLRFINTPAGAVTSGELGRAKVGLKSRVVMSGESTANRAMSIARDVHRLGAPRSLETIIEEIDTVSLAGLNAYLASRDLGVLTCCTLGPEPVTASL
jgi:predicted Zn-dependent peptidase